MNKKQILVVDDEASIRALIAYSFRLLRPTDEVVRVADGFVALEYLWEHHIDLVITDYWMPGLNGLELIQRIRQSWPQLPIILMTGHNPAELAPALDALALAGYLSKPFNPTQLPQMADQVLGCLRCEL